jgi:hypothetical protein
MFVIRPSTGQNLTFSHASIDQGTIAKATFVCYAPVIRSRSGFLQCLIR